MKSKTFKHEKIEECGLCGKIIKTEKDKWAAVIDYVGDETEKIKFYHRFCLTDLIKGQGKIITKNFEEKLKNITGNLLKGLNINQNKIFEIKE